MKKIVQSLREILNHKYTNDEIYSALRNCHMDPYDTVQRLLSQGSFSSSFFFFFFLYLFLLDKRGILFSFFVSEISFAFRY